MTSRWPLVVLFVALGLSTLGASPGASQLGPTPGLAAPAAASLVRDESRLQAHPRLCVRPSGAAEGPASGRSGQLLGVMGDAHGRFELIDAANRPVEGCIPVRVDPGGRLYLPSDRVAVRLQTISFGSSAASFRALGLEPLEQLGAWTLARVDGDPVGEARRLRSLPGVLAAHADLGSTMVAHGDPYLPRQWHLEPIGAPEAWRVTRGRPGLKVAVIDHGVDATHEEFADCRMESAYDAVFARGWEGVDTTGHGTSCAGLIAADDGNGVGLAGLCPRCTIVPIHIALGDDFVLVSDRDSPQLTHILYDSHIARAFQHASDSGAEVISNSWGPSVTHGPYVLAPIAYDAIHSAATEGRGGLGAIVVFAAGNGSGPVDHDGFATHPDTLTVGAVDAAGRHATYSNWGRAVDLVAPSGVGPEGPFDVPAGLWTTDTAGRLGAHAPLGLGEQYGDARGHYTARFSGTSAAAPLVAGAAALLLSVDSSLSAMEVRALLTRNTDRQLPELQEGGHDLRLGHGRLHVGQAVADAVSSRAAARPGDACADGCGDETACDTALAVCALRCENGDRCGAGQGCVDGLCRSSNVCSGFVNDRTEDCDLPAEGRCDDQVLLQCEDGQRIRTDCASLGGHCAWSTTGRFACDLECQGPALAARPAGVCAGDTLVWCSTGSGPSPHRLAIHGCAGACRDGSDETFAECLCEEGKSWCDGATLMRCHDGSPRPIPCEGACITAGDFAYCECIESDRCDGDTAVYCGRDGQSHRYACPERCHLSETGEVDCACNSASKAGECLDPTTLRTCMGGRAIDFLCPQGCVMSEEGSRCAVPGEDVSDAGTMDAGIAPRDYESKHGGLEGQGCQAGGGRRATSFFAPCLGLLLLLTRTRWRRLR